MKNFEKIKELIKQNSELFSQFFLESAKFDPPVSNQAKKKQYLSNNFDLIVKKLCEKITECPEQYDDLIMDLMDWFQETTFPLKNQNLAPIKPQQQVQPSKPLKLQQQNQNQQRPQQTQQYQQSQLQRVLPHLQSPKTSDVPTQNPTFYHQPPSKALNKGVAGYARPMTHQNAESQETRAKKILNKLSDAFDQPERRAIYFEEIKKQLHK